MQNFYFSSAATASAWGSLILSVKNKWGKGEMFAD